MGGNRRPFAGSGWKVPQGGQQFFSSLPWALSEPVAAVCWLPRSLPLEAGPGLAGPDPEWHTSPQGSTYFSTATPPRPDYGE